MIGRNTLGRIVALLAVVALLVSALALSGCGGTKESPGGPKNIEEEKVLDDATKAAIVKALDDAGLEYTKDYLAISEEGGEKYLVTAGTIKKGDTTYREVTVTKGEDGKWTAEAK